MKIKFSIFFLICLLDWLTVQANCSTLDTLLNSSTEKILLKKIEEAKTKSEKANYFFQLVNSLTEKNPGKARGYLNEFKKTITINNADTNVYHYYYLLGEIEYSSGNMDSSAVNYLKALRYAEKLNKINYEINCLNSLAVINMRMKNYVRGIEYFKRNLAVARKTKKTALIDKTMLNLALGYGEAGKTGEAVKILKKIFTTTKNNFYKAVASNSLSYIFNVSHKYKKAYYYASKSISFVDSTYLKFHLESLTNYANALQGLRRYNEAFKITEKILLIAKKNNLQLEYINALGNLSENYKLRGKYKKALEYFEKFATLKDSVYNDEVSRQVNELQIKYETEKKDKALALKNAELQKKELISGIYLFVAVVLLVLSIVIYFFYRKTKQAYLELVRRQVNLIKGNIAGKQWAFKNEKTSGISNERTEEICEELERLLKTEKIYLQKDLTLGKLAGMLKISAKYLSNAIHQKYGENFPDLINNLRVEEASKLLIDKQYANLSIEAIGEMAGFHSRSVFNSAFKKFTGVTPSFYQRSAKQIIALED